MKLTRMTDYVLGSQTFNPFKGMGVRLQKTVNYANFLKLPLELWMFVPCDNEGNLLEEPKENWLYQKGLSETEQHIRIQLLEQYQEAKDRVLFNGFRLVDENKESIWIEVEKTGKDLVFVKETFRGAPYITLSSDYVETIEDLTDLDLELTESAIKRYNL